MTFRRIHIFYISLLCLSVLTNLIVRNEFKANKLARGPASVNYKMVGNLEKIHLGENKDLEYFAKMDSGAESSSLHAKNISTFHRIENDKAVLYVEFDTVDEHQNPQRLIRPVVKIDEIKSSLGRHKRYFIQEKIWIGEHSYFVNVNLTDRSHLKRKFLIGKNVLDQGYIIDTSSIMLASPQ